MRKWIVFIPVIAYGIFILCASAIFGFESMESSAWIYGTFLLTASLLLRKDREIGGIIGIVLAGYLIHLGNNSKTGIEISVGICLILFYTLNIYWIWRSKRKGKKEI